MEKELCDGESWREKKLGKGDKLRERERERERERVSVFNLPLEKTSGRLRLEASTLERTEESLPD